MDFLKYLDANNNFYSRVYINNAAVENWQAYLKKSVYDAQQAAEVGQLSAFYGLQPQTSGWLACLGTDVSRTTFADLFAVIGTTYGSGNGVNTFGLPDFESAGLPATQFVWHIKT